MMIIRPANERGHIMMDWLDTKHSFSFGQYYDPRYMGFHTLRVINEDIVQGGEGFGMHEHRDMEIITYILAGSLDHKDSMGTGSTIHTGEVQYMSAGSGVYHSEFNHSKTKPVHLLQIWILPDTKNLTPRYDQKNFSKRKVPGKLCLVASKTGEEDSIVIHQDASLFIGEFKNAEEIHYKLKQKRHAWIQVAKGAVTVNGKQLHQGDGAAISQEEELKIVGTPSGEILLFDLG
ncbi:MAG: pirin family protein [Gammaproteobacteria bacterium]